MSLKKIGEHGFIRRISHGCLIRSDNIIKAIGDDAAAFKTAPGQITLITTDLLVEGVHFLRNAISGSDLGYKSLAVNLSDIAAMGGTAREAFVSIGIPANCPLDYLDSMYAGMKDLAARFDVNILGGDTTGSSKDLIINVTVCGQVPQDQLLCRDTARIGDIIYSTGMLGDSKAGLYLIKNNLAADSPELKKLLVAHLRPEPQLREGRFLAQLGGVNAMIDVSDGLSTDLGHICEESQVGARLCSDKIPVSEQLGQLCARLNFDPLEFALSGGEDYTLLCTVDPKKSQKIEAEFQRRFKRPLYALGAIIAAKKMECIYPDGRIKPVLPSGWDHFRS